MSASISARPNFLRFLASFCISALTQLCSVHEMFRREMPQNIQNNVNVTRDKGPGTDARGQLTY